VSQRLDLGRVSIVPFNFPVLDQPRATAAAAPSPPLNGGIVAVEPVLAEPVPAEPADEAAAAAAIAQAVSEAGARGYADGLQRGYAEGHEKGYAAGFAEATTAAEERIGDVARRLSAILARLGEPIPALDRRVEEAVVGLALEVARCVIGGEVSRSHEYLVRLIREAIAKVPIEMGLPRVVVNPVDLEMIRALAPEVEGASASLVADDAIEPGGCLVVADGDEQPIRDRRWKPRLGDGVSQVNLTLSSRWRAVMLALFDGEDE
jgi:flagellar assembly protein FliH